MTGARTDHASEGRVAGSFDGAFAVDGVLLDIDDTLVDLHRAMDATLRAVARQTGLAVPTELEDEYSLDFSRDPDGFYDRYLAGELDFATQRQYRVRAAHERLGLEPIADLDGWDAMYTAILPTHFTAFDDVVPLLDALEAAGIPYGALSNNVADYQRAKLDRAGLERIGILIGTDTLGVAKPDPAIFREGARQVGSEPGRTLYVGDNPAVDAVGATDAGLVGVWLDRALAGGRGSVGQGTGLDEGGAGAFTGPVVSSLTDVMHLIAA
ncbi:HAD family hydrolase [Tersicoccus sp. MR15.9]|uniref:HAD family hydrolase n=1 Tax=Tersicoccus mangrovi TaxID=3121635 RepID=UPI002FE5A398